MSDEEVGSEDSLRSRLSLVRELLRPTANDDSTISSSSTSSSYKEFLTGNECSLSSKSSPVLSSESEGSERCTTAKSYNSSTEVRGNGENRAMQRIFVLLGGNFAGIQTKATVEKYLKRSKQFVLYYEQNITFVLDDLQNLPLMIAYKSARNGIHHYRIECKNYENLRTRSWRVVGSWERFWFNSLSRLVQFYRNAHPVCTNDNFHGDLFPIADDSV